MSNLWMLPIGLVILAFMIAIIDYLWYGRKLLGEVPMSSKDVVFFYFSRTISELIALTLGIIIGLQFGGSI